PDGVHRARIPLLAGSYGLEVAAAEATSAPETFALPASGATVRVGLRRPGHFAFRVREAGAVGSDPGVAAGAIVIGHAAAFAERFGIEQSLGAAWTGPDR